MALLCILLLATAGCLYAQKLSDEATLPPITEEVLSMKADDALQATSGDVPTGQLPLDVIGNIKELTPDFAHAVWDDSGKICLLAKLQATFTISYLAQGGDQIANIKLPEETKTKGVCGSDTRDPMIQLVWPTQRSSFQFDVFFSKIPSTKKNQPDSWAVTSMDLNYNTGASVFVGAVNPDQNTARTPENTSLFETPEGKSYFCNSPTVIQMINTKKERIVSVRLQDVHLQPMGVKQAKFAPVNRCSSVRIGGSIPDPFETVPIAVGSTLAVMAVLVVIGYALYKSVLVRRVDYNTMD